MILLVQDELCWNTTWMGDWEVPSCDTIPRIFGVHSEVHFLANLNIVDYCNFLPCSATNVG